MIQAQHSAIENWGEPKTKKPRKSRRGKRTTSSSRPNNHRPTQKLPPVWRESHRRRTKIAIRLRKNRTTPNSPHHHPNRTLWWSVCLLSGWVCCTCTGNGTRFTVWQFYSKLSYISALHSCHQLRTAIVDIWLRLWTKDFSWCHRQLAGEGENQFRRSSKSNTTTVAAGKINLFRWNECES